MQTNTPECWPPRHKQHGLGLCRIPGCGSLIHAPYRLCSPHWRLVPEHLKRACIVSPDQALAVAARYIEAYKLIRKTCECSRQRAHRWLITRHALLQLTPMQMLSTPEGFQRVQSIISATRALP